MKKILLKLFQHQILTQEEAAEVMSKIAAGEYNNEEVAAFISVYMMRSIELSELIGFRNALIETALPIDLSEFDSVDIVGTGGDGKNTFNISTCAGFVVAGAGYKVVKHGNYGATSISGASNVLEYFGAKFSINSDEIKQKLDTSGFTYLHAPLFNPAMKNVLTIRKNLGFRTFFNVLGPLINPAQPRNNLLGTYDLKMMRLYSYIYQSLDKKFSVVHSMDGYDEISLTYRSKVINNKGEQILEPEDIGFKRLKQAELTGGKSVADAASIFLNVLDNKATEAQKNAVIINAAVTIQTIEPDKTLETCINEATKALVNGKAKRAFELYLA